mmetsp:Transcript_57753/g.122855  ORF Transcript_57753/g.122855 Transcript_57753/m.122855 type:complete len:306 (-) Transcript_57753:6-923(-)
MAKKKAKRTLLPGLKQDPLPPESESGGQSNKAKAKPLLAQSTGKRKAGQQEASTSAASSSVSSAASAASAPSLRAAASSGKAAFNNNNNKPAASKVANKLASAPAAAAPPPRPAPRKVGPPTRSHTNGASDRKAFMSGKIASVWGSGGKDVPMEKAKGRKDDVDEESKEFKGILKQVMEMALPEMEKRDRRVYETKKLRALGATLDKGEKMPYRLLQKRAKRLEAERKDKVEEDKNLGVSTNSSKHRLTWQVDKLLSDRKKDYKEKMARRGAREYDIGLGGREKKGMVVIDRQQAKFFTKRANRK